MAETKANIADVRAEQRQAIRWALKLLDGFFELTGMTPKPESRAHMDVLRTMGGK